MIKLKSISKSYGPAEILKDLDLEIESGKLTTLLGQNGSGKSTLLRLISGLEHTTSGEITYLDESVTKIDFSHATDFAFIHENINYIFDFSFSEYIKRIKGTHEHWDDELFNRIISERELNIDKNFNDFSRGQKMQLVLAKALACKTPILLIDEITSVMDVYARKYFLDLLSKYVEEGRTVVITTNIINELEFYTDNLIILKNGGIVLNKPVSDISTQFMKLRKTNDDDHQIFTVNDCVWAGVNSDKSVSYIVSEKLFSQYEVPENLIDRRQSSLEDIFIFYFRQGSMDHEDAA